MKWENYGCYSRKNAEYVKTWLEEHNIITGEIFNINEIFVVPYMAIGSIQKALVENESWNWCFKNNL